MMILGSDERAPQGTHANRELSEKVRLEGRCASAKESRVYFSAIREVTQY